MTGPALRAAETLEGAVIDAALDAIVISRDDGRIGRLNPAAETLFDLTAAQALGLFLSDLIVVPGDVDRRLASEGNGLGGTLGVLGQRVEREARRRGGATVPVEIAIHRVSIGDATLYIAYIRDLTAQREAAMANEGQRLRLNQVEKYSAMSSMLGEVAHELNNPLAILVAQSTVLRDKAPTPDVARRAERIYAAAVRAGKIVKSFLAMAQHKVPVRERLDLNAVLEDAVQFVGYGLRSAGIAVVRDLDPALPAVEADRDLVGQVFASLLVNAKQALLERADQRAIDVRSKRQGDMVLVDIEDNGAGVAPDLAERIFDPYFTTRAASSATGVGLALCRSILAAQGGTIVLREGVTGGALFRVTLPACTPAARDPAGDIEALSPGMSILVVDDERDVAESLAELIELFGHRVRVETSAADALDRIGEEPFDMVFTDYHMPGLDGLAFRRSVTRMDATLAGRMVLMTGDTVSLANRGELTGNPADLTLEKPFTASEVKALLDRIDSRR